METLGVLSVAVPFTSNTMLTPLALLARMNGEVAAMEQVSNPLATAAREQSVFGEPGPMPVSMNIKSDAVGCALFKNVMKPGTGNVPALRFARFPSVAAAQGGPEQRGVFAASNVRVVVGFTVKSNPPGPAFQSIVVAVTVTVPGVPMTKLPIAAPDAAVVANKKQTVRMGAVVKRAQSVS